MPGLPAPQVPPVLDAIERATREIGFPLASDRATGALLRTHAASKPAWQHLALGTAAVAGGAPSWMPAGRDAGATLRSRDTDDTVQAVARRHLGGGPRVRFVVEDAGAWLTRHATQAERFDLVFADAWPGKYSHL